MEYLSDTQYEKEFARLEVAFLEASVLWLGSLLFSDPEDAKSWLLEETQKHLRDVPNIVAHRVSVESDPEIAGKIIEAEIQRAWWRALGVMAIPACSKSAYQKPSRLKTLSDAEGFVDACRAYIEKEIVSYLKLLGRNQSIPGSVATSMLFERASRVVEEVRVRKWEKIFGPELVKWFEAEAVVAGWAMVTNSARLTVAIWEGSIWSGEYQNLLDPRIELHPKREPDRNTSGLPAYLRNLRESRSWTQEFVADKLQKTVRTVNAWEAGTAIPRGEQRINLSELFDVPVEELALRIPPSKT